MPKEMVVSAKAPKIDKEGSVTVQTGKTVEEATQMFGGEQVLSNANANWRVTLQAAVRRYLTAGKSPEEIQGLLGSAKMGVATERISDPLAAATAKFETLDEAGQKAFIKQLKEKLANKG
ncbi:hypothetical protein KAR91_34630 [Candidatus Pacearchaeota archaeon]|nr:hypothetical protein [Candidatus Pacearchaeota archaeon]